MKVGQNLVRSLSQLLHGHVILMCYNAYNSYNLAGGIHEHNSIRRYQYAIAR